VWSDIEHLERKRQAERERERERELTMPYLELGNSMVRWPLNLQHLTLRGNTNSSWKTLPHESIAEGDTADHLCVCLRQILMKQLKTLKILNLIRIRDFFTPVWPSSGDKHAFQDRIPRLPIWKHLEEIHLLYGSITYKVEWFKDTGDLNKHENTREYRNKIALSSARMAMFMPSLRKFSATQRPLLWAGMHSFTYTAEKHVFAELRFSSTFNFVVDERVVEAWETVAAKHAKAKLKVTIDKLDQWPETTGNGVAPTLPTINF
jgi:hypothetical protein